MPTHAGTSLLQLLSGAERLGRLRSLADAYRTAGGTAAEFLHARYTLLFKVTHDREGLHLNPLGWRVADGCQEYWLNGECTVAKGFDPAPLLRDCYASPQGWMVQAVDDEWVITFAIGPEHQAQWLLELHCAGEPQRSQLEALALFLRCFHNQQMQWEYANLDTLTRLLNRKTFEDNFDQLISEAARTQCDPSRTLNAGQLQRPCWLGVIDIDHFKRVNDSFGHLFGDEVLLRVADLMRHNFRADDRLFRFGGEEFVVMIYHAAPEVVGRVFDRFRRAVEEYRFPQIDQVTCSIGFTRIDPSRLPAELLGRADEALYFSKDNGRNQVNDYEELVAQGLVTVTCDNAAAVQQAEADSFFD